MDAKRALRRAAALFALGALATAAPGADAGKDLLNAARTGDADGVLALLRAGVNVEAKDKDGKTSLMWAAEKGHVNIVHMLLGKGVNREARDKEGLTAYDIVLLSSHGKSAAILDLLPKPPRVRIDVDALWLPLNMIGSCFESRADLARTLSGIAPDAMALGAFAEYARTAGKDAVEILRANSEGLKPDAAIAVATDAVATVVLEVRPGVSCSEHSDHLSLVIDVRVIPAAGGAPVFNKTFGGGFKGLHEQPASNPIQYRPLLEQWAKIHASSIYWEVLRVLLRQ
jgi:hypothetical protein